MNYVHTYEGYLEEGNTVRWIGSAPTKEELAQKIPIRVVIPDPTIDHVGNAKKAVEYLEKIARTGVIDDEWIKEWEMSREHKSEMREALERLAKLDPFREIKDPVEWQREIRKDRNIGREYSAISAK